jgi:hypothetical protein
MAVGVEEGIAHAGQPVDAEWQTDGMAKRAGDRGRSGGVELVVHPASICILVEVVVNAIGPMFKQINQQVEREGAAEDSAPPLQHWLGPRGNEVDRSHPRVSYPYPVE